MKTPLRHSRGWNAFLGLLCLFTGQMVQAQSFTNFSFEMPMIADYTQHYQGASTLTGWTIVSNAVLVNRYGGSASAGAQGAIPDGNQVCEVQNGGALSQTVSGFVVGHNYQITIATAYRSGFGGGTLDVAVDGISVGTITPTTTITNSSGSYADKTASFTATATSHTIKFTKSASGIAMIDNVRVTDLGVGALTAGNITAYATTTTSIIPQLGTITGGTAPYSTLFYYSTATNGTYNQIGTAVAGANPVANAAASGLAANTTYYFRAVTTDATGTPVITTPSTTTGTALATSAAANVTINVTDPNWYFSPYTWYSDGSGTLGANNIRAASTYASTNCTGGYFKVGLTTTTAGNITLNLDTTNVASVADGIRPTIWWSVDGGILQPDLRTNPTGYQLTVANLTGTSPTQSVTLATSLAAGSHVIRLWLRSWNSTTNDWTSNGALRVMGLTTPPGTTTSSLGTNLSSTYALFFGDSITEGEGTEGLASTNYVLYSDGTHQYSTYLAQALGSEYGNIGSGGQSYTQGGANGWPAFNTSWNLYNPSNYRLYSAGVPSSTGTFSPTPTDIYVNMGTNNGTDATSAGAMLTNLRTASSANTWIFQIVPFGQFNKSVVLSGLNIFGGGAAGASDKYTSVSGPNGSTIYTSSTDSKVCVIDLGTAAATGLSGPAFNITQQSFDAIHPLREVHAKEAALLSQAVQFKKSGINASIKVRPIGGGPVHK